MLRFCHYVTRFDGYVLRFHPDVLRSSFDVLCLHFTRFFYDVDGFSLYVIINAARQKRPQHIRMETQHETSKPRHIITKRPK